MTMVASGGSLTRAPRPSSLADVLDLILDKGLVIDAYVRVSAVGIELLTIDARIVIASVDTYLHYAEAVNRLDLSNTEARGIPGLVGKDNDRNESGGNHDGDRREPELGEGNEEAEGPDDENQDGEGKRGLASRLRDRGRWS